MRILYIGNDENFLLSGASKEVIDTISKLIQENPMNEAAAKLQARSKLFELSMNSFADGVLKRKGISLESNKPWKTISLSKSERKNKTLEELESLRKDIWMKKNNIA